MRACIWLVASLAPCLLAAGPPPASSARSRLTDEQIERLIEQLGSDRQKARDEATRRLAELDEALPALRRAQRSHDLEIARRTRVLSAQLGKRRVEADRKRIQLDSEAGRADLLAERIALWEGADGDHDLWQPVLDLGWRYFKQYGKITLEKSRSRHRSTYVPGQEFAAFVAKRGATPLPPGRPKFHLKTRAWENLQANPFRPLVRGEEVYGDDDLGGGLIVSSGPMRLAGRQMLSGFVLCGGDLELLDGGQLVVVICDGNGILTQKHRDNLSCSVVVARGSIHCPSGVSDCVILAGGDVTFPDYGRVRDSVIRAGGRVHVPAKTLVTGSTLESGARNHFGPVKFFETADLGVRVAPAKFAVRVADSVGPFARAGLKEGDLVAELDGSPATTPEHFRRLLRRRVVEGGAAALRVRRGGAWLTLRVPLG